VSQSSPAEWIGACIQLDCSGSRQSALVIHFVTAALPDSSMISFYVSTWTIHSINQSQTPFVDSTTEYLSLDMKLKCTPLPDAKSCDKTGLHDSVLL